MKICPALFAPLLLLLPLACIRNDETTVHGHVVDAHTGAPVGSVGLHFLVQKGYYQDSSTPQIVEEKHVASGADGRFDVVLETHCADRIGHLVRAPSNGFVSPGYVTNDPAIRPGRANEREIRVFPLDAVAALHLHHTQLTDSKIQLLVWAPFANAGEPIAGPWFDLPVGDSTIAFVRVSGGEVHDFRLGSKKFLVTVPIGDTLAVYQEY